MSLMWPSIRLIVGLSNIQEVGMRARFIVTAVDRGGSTWGAAAAMAFDPAT